jgi:hypothetical protein
MTACGERIMRSLREFDISTVVLNDRQSLGQPQPQKRARQDAFPKLFTFREGGTAGFSCYNVTPLPENCAPPPVYHWI